MISSEVKICSVCEAGKDSSEFLRAGKYPRSFCVKCSYRKLKEYRNRSPENKASYLRHKENWTKRNKERCKGYQQKRRLKKKYTDLEAKYGLSKRDYNVMLIRQRSVCAICERHNGKIDLAVDHCHETGLVRGLLCRRCNMMIGQSEDSVDVLNRAAKYLENSRNEAEGHDEPNTPQGDNQAGLSCPDQSFARKTYQG